MTVQEMLRVFRANGVPEHFYVIGGLGGGECYGLASQDGRWIVYYSERGQRSILNTFETEDAACRKLVDYVDKMMREDFNRPIDMSKT